MPADWLCALRQHHESCLLIGCVPYRQCRMTDARPNDKETGNGTAKIGIKTFLLSIIDYIWITNFSDTEKSNIRGLIHKALLGLTFDG
jgi:hypothetical protein